EGADDVVVLVDQQGALAPAPGIELGAQVLFTRQSSHPVLQLSQGQLDEVRIVAVQLALPFAAERLQHRLEQGRQAPRLRRLQYERLDLDEELGIVAQA